MVEGIPEPAAILDFWFSERVSGQWFASTPALDQEIRERFESLWEQAARGELEQWQDSPEATLALVIVLDQFPLNMFRGKAKSFQTERQAVAVAKMAIGRGFADLLAHDRLVFLFMPLMHSEVLAEQELSVAMFKQYNLHNNIKFAEHHRDLVKQFGRFPHRNAILGRTSDAAEIQYLQSGHAFRG